MASLVIVPDSDAFFSGAYRRCPCSGGFRHSPVRRRNQFTCRSWSPATNSLSRLLEQVERERNFENLWAPTLLLHLRERRSGEKDSNNTTDKQPSHKIEEKDVSPTEEKTPDKFSVSVELDDAFEPSEISVKLVGKCLTIEGKHEEKRDDGQFSCRQFTRSYYLSDDVDIENLTSALSKEGMLTVEAPKLQLKEKSEERNIPIQPATSPEAVEEKKSEETEELDEEQNENLEAGKSKEVVRQEDTSDKPQAAEPSGKDSE